MHKANTILLKNSLCDLVILSMFLNIFKKIVKKIAKKSPKPVQIYYNIFEEVKPLTKFEKNGGDIYVDN